MDQYLGMRKLLHPWDTIRGHCLRGGGQGTDLERLYRAKPISGTLTLKLCCIIMMPLHLILNISTKTAGGKPGLGQAVFRGSICVTQASKPPLVGVQDGWCLGKALILIVGSQDGKDRNIFSYPHQSQTLMFALGRISDSHSDRKA